MRGHEGSLTSRRLMCGEPRHPVANHRRGRRRKPLHCWQARRTSVGDGDRVLWTLRDSLGKAVWEWCAEEMRGSSTSPCESSSPSSGMRNHLRLIGIAGRWVRAEAPSGVLNAAPRIPRSPPQFTCAASRPDADLEWLRHCVSPLLAGTGARRTAVKPRGSQATTTSRASPQTSQRARCRRRR